MRQCLTALAVLSHKEIVHCDLKPENIMLKSISSPQAPSAPSAQRPVARRPGLVPGARATFPDPASRGLTIREDAGSDRYN
jgi:serine/threonine protein kinase